MAVNMRRCSLGRQGLETGKEWGTIIQLKVVESLVRVPTDTKIFHL